MTDLQNLQAAERHAVKALHHAREAVAYARRGLRKFPSSIKLRHAMEQQEAAVLEAERRLANIREAMRSL